jgi:hypothetical protein
VGIEAQLFVFAMAALLCAPTQAAAQRRMPHQGAEAVGGEIGFFVPKDGAMSTGPAIGGSYETYVNARDSFRLAAEWQNPKVEMEHADSVRQVRIGGDLIHNWEGGTVHPFLGAGVAAYFLQPRDNGTSFGDGATKFGGTLIGGAEFFASKTFAVKGEARYNVVSKWNAYDPSGLVVTIGVKSYF